jgi:hypothetical protein
MCLKELKDVDICGPGKDLNNTCSSSSHYEPSWIWLVPRVTTEPSDRDAGMREEEFNDYMRVEWAKARARMKRWDEELLLVQEEMRRVLEFHKWKAAWWRTQSALRTHDDTAILSGISGYAHKQAAISLRLATQCADYWLLWLKNNGVTPSWAAEYVGFANPSRSHSHRVQLDGALDSEDMTTHVEGDVDLDSDQDDELSEIGDEDDFSDVDNDE